MRRARWPSLVLAAVLAAAGVSACSGSGDDGGGSAVQAAPSAGDPACAALAGRLPSTLLGQQSIASDVTGTARWGDPAIVLRCGVTPPGPTTDACIGISGVDWVFSETDSVYRFVTFGRTPAVEVTVPHQVERTSASGAAAALSPAVKPFKQTDHCIGLGDT